MTSLGPDFRIVSKLGEGSFAEVFKVRATRSGQFYAIKRLKKRYRSIDEVNRLPEVLFLKQLQGNPNVIKLIDLIYDQKNGYVAIVFELMDCNLYELLSEHKRPYSEDISLLLIFQLLLAVSYMHSKNLFHRDIKPENCMVDRETLCLKLCDFGSTRGVSSSAPYTEYVSTRWYRAPECILTSGSYGPEVDEWSAGCMLFELLTTRPLFPGKHEIDQIARIHNLLGTPARDVLAQFRRNPNTQISFQFPQRPAQDLHKLLPKTSYDTIDLLQCLLTYNPQDRISAADALQHPAFATIRRYYNDWLLTDQELPFSAYYLNEVHDYHIKPKVECPLPQTISSLSQNQNDGSYQNTNEYEQKTDQQKLANQTHVSKQNKPFLFHQKQAGMPKPLITNSFSKKPQVYNQIQPKIQPPPLITHSQITGLQGQALGQPLNKPKVKLPAVNQPFDSALLEARIRAAQRIKAYQEKMKSSVKPNQISQQPQYHGHPINYQPPKHGYQMPRPEILKPRLQPQYKITEKSNHSNQYSQLPSINQ